MKRQIMLAAGLMLAATSLQADGIAPNDVVANEYGEIAASLTGQPGNPQRPLRGHSEHALQTQVADVCKSDLQSQSADPSGVLDSSLTLAMRGLYRKCPD